MVSASVAELRGRRNYKHHGVFSFVTLPRAGDMISLMLKDEPLMHSFAVVRCNHVPAPGKDAEANQLVETPSIQLEVVFESVDDDPE